MKGVRAIDTPQRLYHEPASLFVGSFMGLYSMNLLPGHQIKHEGWLKR